MLDSSKISMRECRISEFSMMPSSCDTAEGDAVRLEMGTNFSIEDKDDTSCKVELGISIKPADGSYYVIDATVIATFDIPAETNEKDVDNYLQEAGAERMLDFARLAVESMTAFGVHGPVRIPLSLPTAVSL